MVARSEPGIGFGLPPSNTAPFDRLRLDYEQTTQVLRTLTDIRFKLIAFVPTFAAAGVGFFGHPRPAVELLGIGLLGLAATLGIFLYDLRNSELFAAAAGRARELERRLELSGGMVDAHERGLSLVYGAALAGWSYLVAWGVLRAIGIGGARETGLAIGAGVGLLIVAQARRLG